MRAKYKLTNPSEAEATLEITMSVGDWAKLREQLNEAPHFTSYPASQMRQAIYDLVKLAEQEFEAEHEVEP